MFQNIIKTLGKAHNVLSSNVLTHNFTKAINTSNFHSLCNKLPNSMMSLMTPLTVTSSLPKLPSSQQFRSITVIKFDRMKGKRTTVPEVPLRFFRLDWGMWIRTKCGRHKKMWKKTVKQKYRLRQHVMCNATQCTLLDKMVNNNFKRKRFYVDDPYEPYHSREDFHITRRKPRPLPAEAYYVVDTSP